MGAGSVEVWEPGAWEPGAWGSGSVQWERGSMGVWERGRVEGNLAACNLGKHVDLETWSCVYGSVECK